MNDMYISISQDAPTDGSTVERAAFGQLEISVGGKPLTGLLDRRETSSNAYHSKGPFVSGYHLAEWFATHWWRLRWEPVVKNLESADYPWNLSHRMSAIGEGYIWPNITFNCDGQLCEVTSRRSVDQYTPIEYLGADTTYLSADAWEKAVDRFVVRVLSLLDEANLTNTDLHATWHELSEERNGTHLTAYRRIEALLGFDVDEGNEAHIEAVLGDARELGTEAVTELAVGAGNDRTSASDIQHLSDASGFDLNVEDGISFSPEESMDVATWGQVAAWRIGKQFAQSVRQKAGWLEAPVCNKKLADLAGTSPQAVDCLESSTSFSWAYMPEDAQARIVLKSPRPTNRRFNLARVVGDRIFSSSRCISAEPLSPATLSRSYRQKAQRSFAVELLCPWHAIAGRFEGRYDNEDIEQVAEQFQVSEMVVKNVLENNG